MQKVHKNAIKKRWWLVSGWMIYRMKYDLIQLHFKSADNFARSVIGCIISCSIWLFSVLTFRFRLPLFVFLRCLPPFVFHLCLPVLVFHLWLPLFAFLRCLPVLVFLLCLSLLVFLLCLPLLVFLLFLPVRDANSVAKSFFFQLSLQRLKGYGIRIPTVLSILLAEVLSFPRVRPPALQRSNPRSQSHVRPISILVPPYPDPIGDSSIR